MQSSRGNVSRSVVTITMSLWHRGKGSRGSIEGMLSCVMRASCPMLRNPASSEHAHPSECIFHLAGYVGRTVFRQSPDCRR